MPDADPFADLPPHLRPSPSELDMGMEAATGKPVDHGTAAENLVHINARIAGLEEQLAAVQARRREPGINLVELGEVISGIQSDLDIARQRAADYQAQLPRQN